MRKSCQSRSLAWSALNSSSRLSPPPFPTVPKNIINFAICVSSTAAHFRWLSINRHNLSAQSFANKQAKCFHSRDLSFWRTLFPALRGIELHAYQFCSKLPNTVAMSVKYKELNVVLMKLIHCRASIWGTQDHEFDESVKARWVAKIKLCMFISVWECVKQSVDEAL